MSKKQPTDAQVAVAQHILIIGASASAITYFVSLVMAIAVPMETSTALAILGVDGVIALVAICWAARTIRAGGGW